MWFLVLVASFVAAPVLFSSLTSDMGGGDRSESARADERRGDLFRQLPPPDPARARTDVIGVVDGLAVDDSTTESAVRRATAAIAALPAVESVLDAYQTTRPDCGRRTARRRRFSSHCDEPEAVDAVVDAVQAELDSRARHVLVGHEDMVDDEIEAQAEADLVRAETIAMPVAFVALIVVFGGLLAAVLPLALALASVAGH